MLTVSVSFLALLHFYLLFLFKLPQCLHFSQSYVVKYAIGDDGVYTLNYKYC